MGSIQHEIQLDVSVARAWNAVRQVGLAHKLFAGVLTDGELEGGIRKVTFANGLQVRERIVDVNEERHRVAYSAFEGTPMTHHNASMQILQVGQPNRCRFVWIADFLPDEFGETMLPIMVAGTEALKANLENGAFWKDAEFGQEVRLGDC